MTKAEFELSCKVFTSNEIFRKTGYSLNSTPLNDSLIKMLSFIPKFKRDNNIEKLTFITLTDGASDPAKTNFTIRSTYWDNANAKSQNVKNVINDEITKKSYELYDSTPSVTEALIKMIKDRYDVTILGFYISNTDRSSIYNVLRDHNCFIGKKRFDVTDIRSAFNKDGFYSLKNTGRDDLFIIPSNKTSVEYDLDFDVDEDDSAAKIARTMTKTLTKSRTSRVLLNKFIGYVA